MDKPKDLHKNRGSYPRRLNQAYLKEMIHKAGVLPLRRDFVTLLTYARDNKVIGTQSTGNMPLKMCGGIR